jgi:fructose-1,6-bisphosphatase/inositol monophosphatase family enzyme
VTTPTLAGFDASFAEELALAAGKIQRLYFRPVGIEREIKDDDTPVTRADREINELTVARIREKFGDRVSIQGEEGGHLVDGTEWKVVFDPLDGTFPYGHGIPVSTFSLALLHEGAPVLAVIYDPFGEQLAIAERGRGALLNGRPMKVGAFETIDRRVSIGLVWWKGSRHNVGRLAALLPDRGATVLNLCSISYMGLKVAAGELAATIFPGESAHDSAAIQLLVEEAGGKVTSITGEPQRYDGKVNGHLASNPTLHGRLLDLVREVNQG